ncbi:hypothetical protein ASU31_07625 [Pedobacter ginsenosidimutans]|uniref:Uncharacterized protein n=1 Tax=Pedobacter ginsenosidimutans TaxID=687842 RepID=A0A0T5VT08_9SPHI|nr:hypothetical protein [Pedobacter ginsenosidimutans]KRT16676.1 hypothetical protein ASU31_07625 [Pedobacter ginsenosidimutans]
MIRTNDSQKIDNSTRNYIYTGYLTAIFGGILGLVIGWDLMKKKRKLSTGEKVFSYSLTDRQHGARILILSGICFILLLTLTIIALDA